MNNYTQRKQYPASRTDRTELQDRRREQQEPDRNLWKDRRRNSEDSDNRKRRKKENREERKHISYRCRREESRR